MEILIIVVIVIVVTVIRASGNKAAQQEQQRRKAAMEAARQEAEREAALRAEQEKLNKRQPAVLKPIAPTVAEKTVAPPEARVSQTQPRSGSIPRGAVKPEGPPPRKPARAAAEKAPVRGRTQEPKGRNEVLSPKSPPRPAQAAPAVSPVPGLKLSFDTNAIVQGIIYSEILAGPKALRR